MSHGSSQSDRPPAHRIAVIVDDGSNPFELGVATELFGLRRPELDRPRYDCTLCAPRPQIHMHGGLFTLSGATGLDAVSAAGTVIVPNRPDPLVAPPPSVLAAIRAAGDRGARLVSFCTGTFTLAAAGVLDGRRATPHWRWADLFTRRHPEVRPEPGVLFVDDGDVCTATGSAAALDLGLHLIRRGPGAEVANAVSRRLVFAAHRDGGQRQFVQPGHVAPPVPYRTRPYPTGVADRRTGHAGLPTTRTRGTSPRSRRLRQWPRDRRESAGRAAPAHRPHTHRLPAPVRAGPAIARSDQPRRWRLSRDGG